MTTIRFTNAPLKPCPAKRSTRRSGQKMCQDDQHLGSGPFIGATSKACVIEPCVGQRNVRCATRHAKRPSAEAARQKAGALSCEMAADRYPDAGRRAPTTAELGLADTFASFFAARKLLAITAGGDLPEPVTCGRSNWKCPWTPGQELVPLR